MGKKREREDDKSEQQRHTTAKWRGSIQFGSSKLSVPVTPSQDSSTGTKSKNSILDPDDHTQNEEKSTMFPTDFESLRREHIRPLIELNDRINALTSSETQINSTRIVVAGDQSHGKTSLLEALSGVDLPRGEGIVTRVPLILQLRGCNNENEEGATIKHTDEGAQEVHISFTQISKKVVEFTNVAAGNGKDVKNKPIELKIFRKGQDDLTLIDLPGITRVALDDQAGGNDKKLEALIMGMCREYMKPKESILLNVVNAMVDFTTSASLALSRELDPTGSRTMLCITKVDQYREDGFHEKVTKAIQTMKLNPDYVFCMRNRSQKENDQSLPLDQVRAEEMRLLEEMTDGKVVEYQLGVQALSKSLVKKQCQEIMSTLPATQKKIETLFDSLNSELDSLGEPVGDIGSCRGRAVELIDSCITRLQNELNGWYSHGHDDDIKRESCEGESFELYLKDSDIKEILQREGNLSENLFSEWEEFADCSFCLEVKIIAGKRIGLYLYVSRENETVEQVRVDCTFVAVSDEKELKKIHMDHKFDLPTKKNIGYPEFLDVSEEKVKNAKEIVFTASVYVKAITYKNTSDSTKKSQNSMLCSRLVDLQESFTSSIDKLYSNHYFFSKEFRTNLAKEVAASRGGIGLPGAIPAHIPPSILQKLQRKLPEPIREYRNKVFRECRQVLDMVVDECVDATVFPRLHHLLATKAKQLLTKKSKEVELYHKKKIEWESTTIATTNHYFMDTVQSIRSKIFDYSTLPGFGASVFSKKHENKIPTVKEPYLKHLTPAVIKAMSNEEQKLVDEQIEIFAYWKVMKKRLVDDIILSTKSEMAAKLINQELKPMFLNAVLNQSKDESLIKLMSPDENIVKKRAILADRVKKLQEALEEIDSFQSKYMGGIVDM